jgi:hypothetical protein
MDGDAAIPISEKKKRRGRPIHRDRLTSEPPFTPASLAATLRRALGNRYAAPGDAEVATLASIFNHWHRYYYDVQRAGDLDKLVDQAKPALDVLMSVVPQIREILHQRDIAEREQNQFTKWSLKAANDAVYFLTNRCDYLLPRDGRADDIKDWRWLIGVLPVDIDTALRPANPDLPKGYNKGGPIPDILAEVIPAITGDRVTSIGVWNQLKPHTAPIF